VVLETCLTGQMAWCYELRMVVMRSLHRCTWTAQKARWAFFWKLLLYCGSKIEVVSSIRVTKLCETFRV